MIRFCGNGVKMLKRNFKIWENIRKICTNS